MKNLKDMTKIRRILFYIKDTIKVHMFDIIKPGYNKWLNSLPIIY